MARPKKVNLENTDTSEKNVVKVGDEKKPATIEDIKKEIQKLNDNSDSVKVDRVIFNDVEGKMLLIKVGNADKPASAEDIEEVEMKVTKLLKDNDINCTILVTHHAVEVSIIR